MSYEILDLKLDTSVADPVLGTIFTIPLQNIKDITILLNGVETTNYYYDNNVISFQNYIIPVSSNVSLKIQWTAKSNSNYDINLGNGEDGWGINASFLTEVISWYNGQNGFNITSFNYGFAQCIKLTTVPTSIASNVTNLSGMFFKASSFNQDISGWDTSSVKYMVSMFKETYFNQSLGAWKIPLVIDMSSMLADSDLDTTNYSNTLIGWADQGGIGSSIQSGVILGSDGLIYDTIAQSAYDKLTGQYQWIIKGTKDPIEPEQELFNIEFEVPTGLIDKSFNVPLLNIIITDVFLNSESLTNLTDYTYDPSTGIDIVSLHKIIDGINNIEVFFSGILNDQMPIRLGNDSFGWKNPAFLTSITQWHHNSSLLSITSFQNAFTDCINLIKVPKTLPQNVKTLSNMFNGATQFNQPIGNWDTSSVNDMSGMFNGATQFNQPIGSWNTSNVNNMSGMFSSARAFNQSISNWTTSSVNNMSDMFNGAVVFNQPIGNWNTSSVTDMNGMFSRASSFNQPIGNWNTSNVNNMSNMFNGANVFNQPIENWNTSVVNNMEFMFSGTFAFNQPIGIWDTSAVNLMVGMFSYSTSFNQPIENWNTSNVNDMSDMFNGAVAFNQPIGNWNTSNVIFMDFMFNNAVAFNQPIGNWNTSNLNELNYMFYGATSFNQDISNWNTSEVYEMNFIFQNATSFNQNLGNWKIPTVFIMANMLSSSGLNTINYSNTLIGWAGQAPNIESGVILDANGLTYSGDAAVAARKLLTDSSVLGGYNWTITGDTYVPI